MRRNLRTALIIVAMVSIVIALYYPVTQYLEGKTLDDEMLLLRRLKADGSGAPETEPDPIQPGTGADSEGALGEESVKKTETGEIAPSETDRNAEPEASNSELTDRKTVLEEKQTGRLASPGGAAESETDQVAAARETEGRTAAPDEAVGHETDHGTITGDLPSSTNGEGAAESVAKNHRTEQTGVGPRNPPGPANDSPVSQERASGLNATPAPPVNTEPDPFVFDEGAILPELKPLYEMNNDLVGWLTIDGTMVDYPVLRRPDEEYYLTRDFYGRDNANGQLILDAQCDPFTPDLNLVISGHDMKSGKMFGTLQRYASERFGRQHPIIEFDTLFRRAKYRLVAAFHTWDYLKREDGFRYNVDINYRLELITYLEELERYKLYDTGVAVEFGDQLITLSTCSARTDEGRFVVVARRLRDGES